MNRKDKHKQIIEKLRDKYQNQLDDKKEFIIDGPSNWDLYEASKPKILFLVKESRQGYHPSIPNQITNTKFMRNLARWKCLINEIYNGKSECMIPSSEHLPKTIDDVAIVEVKKINVENIFSNAKDLKSYAKADKEFLKEQIEIINPEIILCCNTIDCFNIIFDNEYEISERFVKKGNASCANVDNRLVIDFFHPSTFGFGTLTKRDIYLHGLLGDLLKNEMTKNFMQNI